MPPKGLCPEEKIPSIWFLKNFKLSNACIRYFSCLQNKIKVLQYFEGISNYFSNRTFQRKMIQLKGNLDKKSSVSKEANFTIFSNVNPCLSWISRSINSKRYAECL